MRQVIAGTRNQAKIAELAAVLSGVAKIVAPPAGISPDEEEDGTTVEEVAAVKAVVWSRALGEDCTRRGRRLPATADC